MYRYIALVWDARTSGEVRALQTLRATVDAQSSGWSLAHEGPGILVIHKGARKNGADTRSLYAGAGVILGSIFRRRETNYASRPLIRFDEHESARIICTAGRHLIDQYWGAYVAIIYDSKGHRHHVIRDPSASICCYHTRCDGVEVFFSHVEECVRLLPVSFSIDEDYLRRWLVFSGMQSRSSGLDNVANLIGGERLTLCEGAITRDLIWNPVDIAKRPRLEHPDDAAKELRSVVQNTIDAWASCYSEITHQLSGGLDSSIVAGCLAQSPSKPNVRYLNLSADIGFDQEPLHVPGLEKPFADKIRAISGTGDERYFARLVAEKWKVPLIERARSSAMDLSRLWRAPLMASPPLLFTSMELDDAKVELAREFGTQAFFSGLAGDSAFLATIQPLPAMDYAYVHGIDIRLWRQVLTTAALSKDSAWSVLKKAAVHGILRKPYRSPVKMLTSATMLKEELTTNLTADDFAGFWQKMATDLPPGKQLHLAGITGPIYDDYVFASGNYADHVEPLHSQPVSEVMLQIPTYVALVNGVSRGLARRAFADLLPDEIRRRQVKGTGNPFYQHVVRHNLELLREHLLDGRLVADGYLDRRKLAAFLSSNEPVFVSVQASRLLSYLSAEIWLHQWADLRQRIAA